MNNSRAVLGALANIILAFIAFTVLPGSIGLLVGLFLLSLAVVSILRYQSSKGKQSTSRKATQYNPVNTPYQISRSEGRDRADQAAHYRSINTPSQASTNSSDDNESGGLSEYEERAYERKKMLEEYYEERRRKNDD